MSPNARKCTFWYVHHTKTQVSLSICTVWSGLIVHMKKLCIFGYPKCTQWRFWSDCMNVQVDLNLRWAHISKLQCKKRVFELQHSPNEFSRWQFVFIIFFQGIRVWYFLCKLSSLETVCMKYQTPFNEKKSIFQNVVWSFYSKFDVNTCELEKSR